MTPFLYILNHPPETRYETAEAKGISVPLQRSAFFANQIARTGIGKDQKSAQMWSEGVAESRKWIPFFSSSSISSNSIGHLWARLFLLTKHGRWMLAVTIAESRGHFSGSRGAQSAPNGADRSFPLHFAFSFPDLRSRMRSVVLLSALYFASGSAFFFPSLGGGAAGCNCQTQPACPPAPVCSPAPAPVCPPPPSCGAPCSGGSCGGGPSYSGPVSSGCSGAGCGGEAVYAPSSGCSGPSCGGGSSSGCSGASCGGGQSYAASASGGCSGGACGGASVVSGCSGAGCGGGAVYQAPAVSYVPQQQFQALPVQQPVLNQQQQPAPVPIAPIPVTNYASVPAPAAVYQQQAQPVPAPQPTYQQPQPVAQQTYQQQPQQVPVEKNPVSVEPSPLRSEGYTSSGEQYVQPEQANHAAAGDRLQEVVDEDVAPSSVAEASAEANETLSHEVAEPIPISELKLTEDALCNNEELRKLMLDNIEENLNTSKRLIQVAAETAFGGRFDVICSNQDFSYITNTLLFCQETKGDVSCYTYRQL